MHIFKIICITIWNQRIFRLIENIQLSYTVYLKFKIWNIKNSIEIFEYLFNTSFKIL